MSQLLPANPTSEQPAPGTAVGSGAWCRDPHSPLVQGHHLLPLGEPALPPPQAHRDASTGPSELSGEAAGCWVQLSPLGNFFSRRCSKPHSTHCTQRERPWGKVTK